MSLFSVQFWFNIHPPALSLVGLVVLGIIFLVFLVVGVLVLRRTGKAGKHQARLLSRLGSWFLTWAVLGFVWLFFAYERINVFGARFWVLIGFVVAVVWLVPIIRYAKQTIPQLDAAARTRREFEKYLPKKKR